MPSFRPRRWARLPRPAADWQLALLVAAFIVVAQNLRFWRMTFAALGEGTLESAAFFASLAAVLLFLHAALLWLMPGRVAFRSAATVLLVVGAAGSHFIDRYGVAMNGEMMQNLLETDTAEAADLLDPDLALRLLLLGGLPAFVTWRIAVPPQPAGQRLRRHAVLLAAGLLACLAGALATSQSWAYFLREQKPLRSFLTPGAILVNLPPQLLAAGRTLPPLEDPAGALRATPGRHERPRFVVLVVGETARAANFGLAGYGRDTTPRLGERGDVVFFRDVTACGTSTAISVPCLFSHAGSKGRGDDDHRYLNLLDMLQGGGVGVSWLDNNSGCKGVCSRIPSTQYPVRSRHDPLCHGAHCFDAVLRPAVEAALAETLRDTWRHDRVVVLHQVGSHGPAYFERYPPEAEVFKPACRTARLDHCSAQEIVIAYDNTIRYTDANLADLIELLADPRWRGVETALLYVSDHGESLGEQGVYLHGLPRQIAPDTQTRVPLVLWLSAALRDTLRLDEQCLRRRAAQPASHDNVFHTMLGLLGRANAAYRSELDLGNECRSAA